MATKSNIVIVNENIGATGAVVWWTFSGDVAHQQLCDSLAQRGFTEDFFPNPTTHERALGRAAKAQEEKRFLARPLGRAAGWAMVREVVQDDGNLKHEQVCKLTLRKDVLDIEPAGNPDGLRVKADYEAYLPLISANDVGIWLVLLSEAKLMAVSLRQRGGLYFIPANVVPLWRSLTAAIQQVNPNFKLYEVPAMKSDEAVRAVLDAVVREAEEESAQMQQQLDDGALGKRALSSRVTRCDDIKAKLAHYEELLGVSLDKLRGNIDSLQADLGAAALASLAADEAA